MLKQVFELSESLDNRIMLIWKDIATKNKQPVLGYDAYGLPIQLRDTCTIGEKLDAIIDYLGIEIVKNPATPPTVVARKKKK
ncbi:MAG: hypothetical protein PHC68_02570 [Syntrophorhabdaceae bacterium]|jgi:hypothetical protein|nr:hypothetical protein [Syntrophorhabdaceae bacterium]